MKELNGNEKYHYLSKSLPTNFENIGTIHAGDIMLYGDDCLVIFYESFNTSYHYNKIGHIDYENLRDLLGDGNVTVRINNNMKIIRMLIDIVMFILMLILMDHISPIILSTKYSALQHLSFL